jgi:DNA repair protein RecO (recombination protein O)
MQRIESQPAFVLHATSYQESSLLLELFTQDYGRIAVIAKGAKRGKNRRQALLQPFIPLSISCVGRGELLTLTEVDVEGRHLMLMGRRLVLGFYMNEVLMRVLHRNDAHPELFPIYQNTLIDLEQEMDVIEQKALRLFEKSLLKAIGYELQLTQETESGVHVQPDQFYTFDCEYGPSQVMDKSSYALRSEKYHSPSKYHARSAANTSIYKGKSLLALSTGIFNDTTELLDAKRLMRVALARHLGNRPLESRRLL